MKPWPEPVERVAAVLRGRAVDAHIEELPAPAPSAAAAARAVGCEKSEIVKSLVFVCDGLPVLALLPGDRRADAEKIAAAVGAGAARVAAPAEVLAATGFEPGGVAPFPAPHVSRTVLERRLLRNELVWVGAGTAAHMVALAPADLVRLTRAEVADVAEA